VNARDGENPLRADIDWAGLSAAVEARGARQWLADAGVRSVHAGIWDTSGTLREKRLSAGAAAQALEDGWNFIDAIERWAPDDRTWQSGGSVHAPVTLDPATARPYPFEPGAALVLGDFLGPLAPTCSPRAALAQTIERARALGLEAEVGWEFECIVLDQPTSEITAGAPLRAAMADNRCWSALTPAVHAQTLGALSDVLAAGAVPLDHLCAELGPGCVELATEHRRALRSADDAALAKLFTKAFFAQRSQTASFMAQLAEDFPGLGGHPSLSLHWMADGRPALAERSGTLSKVAGSAIAGVVALLPELAVMFAPNPNSYRRYAPGNWAPRRANWGQGNYSCGLRVLSDSPETARLELRTPGADVDPYLGLAGFLGAAVWGIEGGLEPPPPLNAPADGRLDASSPALPRDLTDAIERFARSEAAEHLFGASFVAHYAASRTVEDEACRRFVPPGERHRYLSEA
jgi:glutamine synthetase